MLFYFFRLHSERIFIFSSYGCSISPVKVKVWDFKTATADSTTSSPVQPLCSFEVYNFFTFQNIVSVNKSVFYKIKLIF